MFYGTPYSWLDSHWLDNIAIAENRLDQQYYLDLWNAANRIPARKIGAMLDLIRWEIIYQNVIWALRVRRYYGMTRKDAAGMFVDVKGVDTVSLAMETFRYDIDNLATFSPGPSVNCCPPRQGRASMCRSWKFARRRTFSLWSAEICICIRSAIRRFIAISSFWSMRHPCSWPCSRA